jgi:HEAT repeat protein
MVSVRHMTILDSLLEKLKSDNLTDYLKASAELLIMGQAAMLALIEIMLTHHDRQGWRAARLLAEIADPSTTPAFVQALRSSNPLIRQTAAQALGSQGTKDTVPILLDHLDDEDCVMQIWIVEALGDLGDETAVTPLLTLLVKTDSTVIQYGVIKALGRIGDPRATPALPHFFNSQDRHVRSRSREVYEQLTGSSIGD